MFGYVLLKEAELLRVNEDLALLEHLRELSGKFDHEMSDLRKLAGEKGRALELLSEHVKDLREGIQEGEKRRREMSARAAFAEDMVRQQRSTIEQVMASNERMVELVASMRRVGFGILEPIETNDTPATVDQADREAVELNPDLEYDDD